MTETEIIDGFEISTVKLPARRALTLFKRLVTVFGPVLDRLSGITAKSDVMALVPAISEALSKVSDEEFLSMTSQILATTTVINTDKKKFDLSSSANIDGAFTGELPMLFKVIAYVLKVNYANFFNGVPTA